MKIDAAEALEISDALITEGVAFRKRPGSWGRLVRVLSSGRVLVMTAIVVKSLEAASSLNDE